MNFFLTKDPKRFIFNGKLFQYHLIFSFQYQLTNGGDPDSGYDDSDTDSNRSLLGKKGRKKTTKTSKRKTYVTIGSDSDTSENEAAEPFAADANAIAASSSVSQQSVQVRKLLIILFF